MGKPVGVIANNPRFAAGILDVNASDKASRFIRFCDAFNIPLFEPSPMFPDICRATNQEWAGIIRHGAKLLHGLFGSDGAENNCHHPQSLRRSIYRYVQ